MSRCNSEAVCPCTYAPPSLTSTAPQQLGRLSRSFRSSCYQLGATRERWPCSLNLVSRASQETASLLKLANLLLPEDTILPPQKICPPSSSSSSNSNERARAHSHLFEYPVTSSSFLDRNLTQTCTVLFSPFIHRFILLAYIAIIDFLLLSFSLLHPFHTLLSRRDNHINKHKSEPRAHIQTPSTCTQSPTWQLSPDPTLSDCCLAHSPKFLRSRLESSNAKPPLSPDKQERGFTWSSRISQAQAQASTQAQIQ